MSSLINYLHAMLCQQALKEIKELEIQNNVTENFHFNQIQEGLLRYFSLINALFNKNRAMCRAINRPCHVPFNTFAAKMMELKNGLSLLPGSRYVNKMETKELNKILLHAVTNEWAENSYLQALTFEVETYKETCKMFEHMELAE